MFPVVIIPGVTGSALSNKDGKWVWYSQDPNFEYLSLLLSLQSLLFSSISSISCISFIFIVVHGYVLLFDSEVLGISPGSTL